MPITLYLKYDPLAVLSENCELGTAADDAKEEDGGGGAAAAGESCNYWKSLQDDIYRWAVDEQAEWWRTVRDCDVVTMPPIQSAAIEGGIARYFQTADHRKMVQQTLRKDRNMIFPDLRTLSSFVAEDEHFKSLGAMECVENAKHTLFWNCF